LDEGGEAEPDPAPVEDRPVAADRAVVLEALEAAQARRGGEVHAFGQSGIGEAAIGLEVAQDRAIGVIHWHMIARAGDSTGGFDTKCPRPGRILLAWMITHRPRIGRSTCSPTMSPPPGPAPTLSAASPRRTRSPRGSSSAGSTGTAAWTPR